MFSRVACLVKASGDFELYSGKVFLPMQPSLSKYSRSQEIWACLALSKARNLGCRTWQKILEVFRSPAQAVARSGYWAEMGLVSKSQAGNFLSRDWEREAAYEFERIQSGQDQVLIWTDPEYPDHLRHIPGPPILLYYLGDISLLGNPCLAVVGSRNSSRYGLEMAAAICRDLSRHGLTIVSGFAEGIDRQAHMAGLSGSGGTIAVLGTGIDLIYPALNRDLWEPIKKRGLFLSEFQRGTRPEAHNFPFRNRIISGLSLGVLVVQAALKSGSMLTAGYALEQGREVFAVPGAVNLESFTGCNHLIRQGALLVQSADDVLEALTPSLGAYLKPDKLEKEVKCGQNNHLFDGLNSEELKVANVLSERGRIHIDELTDLLDMNAAGVSRILIHLEIQGVIKREQGMYFSII